MPMVPGVPAAGHVTSGGAWHPSAIDGCAKCTPAPRRDMVCGSCSEPVTYRVTGSRGLWTHDSNGRFHCEAPHRGDANTHQIPNPRSTR